MKAMVLRGPNEPFVLEDWPDPTPGPGEAVARVLACGSGLTIQHVRAGRTGANFPIVIGHEITGEIVAVGPRTETLPVIEPLRNGDPVTCWFYLIEGEDRWTRSDRPTISTKIQGHVGRQIDGGYAEYIKLPVQNFIKLPEALDWRGHPAEAGVICDATATPYKVLRRGRVGPRDTVAVFGAGGGVGLHQVMMCKWAHARVIAVEVASHKFAACRDAGADAVVDANADNVVDAIHELTKGAGVDVAIDYVSSTQTLEQGVAALGIGGRLVTLGGSAGKPFTVSAQIMLRKELELLGSRYCTRQEVIDSLELVAHGEIRPIVTETYPLEEAEHVHQRLEQGLVTGRAALMIGA
ncbi:MAG: zinc-binding dehydrogenase [Alphaproteobacteria bacterium]|nr:zinc-binding dehydrogenase [Alphaproteobacteria bacterium]